MDNIFYQVLLSDRIKIEPKYLCASFRDFLQKKLIESVEGKCTKHGFVKEKSVKVHKIAPGNIELVGLNGYITYNIDFYAEVCNPMIGNIIKAKVINVNKFGILAEAANVLEIIVAKNSVNIANDTSVDVEKIKIGDSILVQVMGKKYVLNEQKISIVGRVVSPKYMMSLKKPNDEKEKDKDEEEEEVIDIMEDDDESSESEDSEEDKEGDAEADIENDIDDEDDEEHKGGTGFFDSDNEFDEPEYEFYSDEEYNEDSDNENNDEY